MTMSVGDRSVVAPPSITDACRASATAAEAAMRCAERLEDAVATMQPRNAQNARDCFEACHDAFTVLTAASVMLERPLHPARMAAVRRMLEAGLVAAVECAAQCELWVDDEPAAAECARQCHGCADILRAALRDVADETTDEMSGAT
jgi:hypothetical protein